LYNNCFSFFSICLCPFVPLETVRLVGGKSRCAGRVEVLHDGQWGTVRDLGWDMADAAVVCRELGCGEALSAPKGAYFGEGSGVIWISNLLCTGSESTFLNCGFFGWGVKAKHTEDAGVVCSGKLCSSMLLS